MHPFYHHPPSPPQQHIHYHYHYHYDDGRYEDRPYSPRQEIYIPSQKQAKISTPKTYSSSIQTNYWKKHVNPQISKLYDNYQARKSRFSENPNRISEQDSVVEDTPTLSKHLLQTKCDENTTFGQISRPLSKLETLYYSKKLTKKSKNVGQADEISNEGEDQFCKIHEQKLKIYKKQIQRLKMVQQQCIYLRDHFMLHVEAKHPSK